MRGLIADEESKEVGFGQGRKRRGYNYAIRIALAVVFTPLALWTVISSRSFLSHHQDVMSASPFHWKQCDSDPHYLCGHLTVPLDWTNSSDSRTIDIATTLYQPRPGQKTSRTLVIEPGGPGGSGTSMLWAKGKQFGDLYTRGELDVLGFDPRGVNLSAPISCFAKDAYRDRWHWTTFSWPEVRGYQVVDDTDAMNEATYMACRDIYGDYPRFVTTAFVARDVDAIRDALGEEHLTAFMVSYGTGIGQTYAQMFPDRVGRVVLDGMEYVRDGWQPWGWGTTSLDNVTNAFEDGFVGECVRAGSGRCALASTEHVTDIEYESAREDLSSRLHGLIDGLATRPIPGYSEHGPGIVTYEHVVGWLYTILYKPSTWKESAQLLAELEKGNATLALLALDGLAWSYDPEPSFPTTAKETKSEELEMMVICGDGYDSEKKSLEWWKDLHAQMINTSWISGSERFAATVQCRHYDYIPAEVYRGDFKHKLNHPLLLLGSIYDPATPVRNARRLAAEMGENARLVVHHGYGHSTARDMSKCTNDIVRAYIMDDELPEKSETDCYADKKPYDDDFEHIG